MDYIFDLRTPIGIDLETNSIYVYKQEICLMQIEVSQEIYLLDILKLGMPPSLKDLLTSPLIQKTFQDMQFDLAIIKSQFDCQPTNLFDISTCDRMLGNQSNHPSLEIMEEKYLGVAIETKKKLQKSNWGIRPLAKNQIHYAAKDVLNLVRIKEKMESILERDFRLGCFQTYMDNFTPINLERKFNINFMWNKKVMLKEPDNLSQIVLTKLKQILIIRENSAEKFNKPSHWVIPDQKLLSIAERQFKSSQDLIHYLGFRNTKPFHRFVVNEIIKKTQSLDQEIITEPPLGTSLKRWAPVSIRESSPETKYRIKYFKEWTKTCSYRMKILPEFLFDKKSGPWIDFDDISGNPLEPIEFPGISSKYTTMFANDLKQYLDSGTSTLEFEEVDIATRIQYSQT
ncbi:MAG: hypothetical protein IH840_05485 [Candidatus Heimdallarchaeota archaeon]|nr:hypothetical protein [Candidatus Heimdallarchaeota archaeon]